jgi:hypothetical protein
MEDFTFDIIHFLSNLALIIYLKYYELLDQIGYFFGYVRISILQIIFIWIGLPTIISWLVRSLIIGYEIKQEEMQIQEIVSYWITFLIILSFCGRLYDLYIDISLYNLYY